MEFEEEQKNKVEISIFKGDKLFNECVPLVINLFSPEPKEQDEKRISADLICVIDISGSMMGDKIYQVRESLKILVDMMDPKDRLALVLFDQSAKLYYDLNYLDAKNKAEIKKLIENIEANGGTNIASGLEIAVEILKKEKKNTKSEEGRSSTVILLSDGCDNYMNDIQLGEKLKSLTKGEGLSFTLNTFGYGYDHDPKIMKRLADLRDGSFFLIEDFKKVGESFVSVLGGCISMISKNAELQVKILNQNCKLIKIFGEKNFYSHEFNNMSFKNKMLQFITGKDYTFVFELDINESSVKPDDVLLDVYFNYDDILTKKTIKLNSQYKYQIKDLQFAKANEEYIRCQTYDILERALKLRDDNKYEEGKKLLKEMRTWLEKNYKGENKTYLEDVIKSETIFENSHQARRDYTSTYNMVSQNMSKRMGTNNMYSNSIQMRLQDNYRMNYAMSQQAPHIINKNNNKFI